MLLRKWGESVENENEKERKRERRRERRKQIEISLAFIQGWKNAAAMKDQVGLQLVRF